MAEQQKTAPPTCGRGGAKEAKALAKVVAVLEEEGLEPYAIEAVLEGALLIISPYWAWRDRFDRFVEDRSDARSALR